MASAEPEAALKELETLQKYNVVHEGDRVKAFIEWAREHAERLYPDVGQRGYVVPPIFVHKHSTRYDQAAGAEVLQEYQKSSPKGEKAHSHVARSFCLLTPRLEKPLFIISGLEYDNLLKWVRHHPALAPPLPRAVENRGDIDIMLIHPSHGVLFVQVKAVGDNAESRTQSEIQKKIVLGGKQLRKDDNILRWVLQDWPEASSCHVTHVVALPNLTRQELASFWPPSDLDLDPASEEAKFTEGVLFLCKDDLPTPEEPAIPEADMEVTPLMRWWNAYISGVTGSLSVPFMKDMVSRYVGMLSAVEVYAGNNLRREVRLTSDAIDVCGMMFRRILLNEQQLRILSAPCGRRYLSGPPGSGKTVLLVLRARRFVRQGGHVIVVNMYRGAAGRAIGHYIRDSVARFRVPQGHEGRKGKAKTKAKKKKGEERMQTEDSPTPAPKNHGTPPTPRKARDAPPPSHRTQEENIAQSHMPWAKRNQGALPVSARTPPCAKKTPGVSACCGTRKKDASVCGAPRPGTPPTAKKTGASAREAQSTPPTARKHQDTEVDRSDRVHSVDIDIDRASFNRQDFRDQIRQCLPPDVKAEDVMFVVDEIYVKEYWSDVLDVLNPGFQGCTIWCAGLYSRNPPSFQQEDLLHVLRCPPLVQKVLHAVDWDPDRRSRYHLDTDSSSGIYTRGLPPLSLRHQGHPQVSITECPQCASLLASLLHHSLGLAVPPPRPCSALTHSAGSATPSALQGFSPSPLPPGPNTPSGPGGRCSPSGPRGRCSPSGPGGRCSPSVPGGRCSPSVPGGRCSPSVPGGRCSPSGPAASASMLSPGEPCQRCAAAGSGLVSSCGESGHLIVPGGAEFSARCQGSDGVTGPGKSGQVGSREDPGQVPSAGQPCEASTTGGCCQLSSPGTCGQSPCSGGSGQPPAAVSTSGECGRPGSGGPGQTSGSAESVPLLCSDVVVLVNIPRALYEPDERGFLDTTKQDFSAYMAYLATCPLMTTLRAAGVPINVVEDLPCCDLHHLPDGQVSVAWAYTYQGLENKVVIYLPGDTPWTPDPYGREIPAPGLSPVPRPQPKVWRPTTAQQVFSASSSSSGGHGDRGGDVRLTAGHEQACGGGQGSGGQGSDGHEGGDGGHSLAQYWWRDEDIQRFSNWDKSNLFVAGSRCLSQLIMLIP